MTSRISNYSSIMANEFKCYIVLEWLEYMHETVKYSEGIHLRRDAHKQKREHSITAKVMLPIYGRIPRVKIEIYLKNIQDLQLRNKSG